MRQFSSSDWTYRHCVNVAPSATYPASRSFLVDSFIPAPIWERHGLSVNGDHDVFASVVSLNNGSSPSAVILGIALIVVNSINAVARRALAHVFQKAFKRQPSFANGNAALAVVSVSFIARTKTSGLHVLPRPVSSAPFPSLPMALTMSSTGLDGPFPLEATARLCASRFKRNSSHEGCSSAVTKALPFDIFRDMVRSFDDSKATKPSAGYINECWHTTLSRIFSYVVAWKPVRIRCLVANLSTQYNYNIIGVPI